MSATWKADGGRVLLIDDDGTILEATFRYDSAAAAQEAADRLNQEAREQARLHAERARRRMEANRMTKLERLQDIQRRSEAGEPVTTDDTQFIQDTLVELQPAIHTMVAAIAAASAAFAAFAEGVAAAIRSRNKLDTTP